MRLVFEKVRTPDGRLQDIVFCAFGEFKEIDPPSDGCTWVQLFGGKPVAAFRPDEILVIDINTETKATCSKSRPYPLEPSLPAVVTKKTRKPRRKS